MLLTSERMWFCFPMREIFIVLVINEFLTLEIVWFSEIIKCVVFTRFYFRFTTGLIKEPQ